MKRGPADARMETQDISPLTSLSKEHTQRSAAFPGLVGVRRFALFLQYPFGSASGESISQAPVAGRERCAACGCRRWHGSAFPAAGYMPAIRNARLQGRIVKNQGHAVICCACRWLIASGLRDDPQDLRRAHLRCVFYASGDPERFPDHNGYTRAA